MIGTWLVVLRENLLQFTVMHVYYNTTLTVW